MPVKRPRKEWADPNREGQGSGRQAERFCSKCGNTVKQTRILKALNLCEFCVRDLQDARDGINSCRACGKIAPLELKEHQGYCTQCVCEACGKPDPQYVRKTGLCFQCAVTLGDFCRSCGKEATAQVHKNKGFCDECVANNRHKKLGRHRRSTGYKGKGLGGRINKTTNQTLNQRQMGVAKPELKNSTGETKREMPSFKRSKPVEAKTRNGMKPKRVGIRNKTNRSSKKV